MCQLIIVQVEIKEFTNSKIKCLSQRYEITFDHLDIVLTAKFLIACCVPCKSLLQLPPWRSTTFLKLVNGDNFCSCQIKGNLGRILNGVVALITLQFSGLHTLCDIEHCCITWWQYRYICHTMWLINNSIVKSQADWKPDCLHLVLTIKKIWKKSQHIYVRYTVQDSDPSHQKLPYKGIQHIHALPQQRNELLNAVVMKTNTQHWCIINKYIFMHYSFKVECSLSTTLKASALTWFNVQKQMLPHTHKKFKFFLKNTCQHWPELIALCNNILQQRPRW